MVMKTKTLQEIESDKIQSEFHHLIEESIKLNPLLTYQASLEACIITKLGELQAEIIKLKNELNQPL
jgi:hypothetical protein